MESEELRRQYAKEQKVFIEGWPKITYSEWLEGYIDTVELINNPLQERVEELENLTKKLKDGLDYFYGLSKRKEDYVSVPKELSEKQEAGLRASSIDFFGVQIFAVHKILVKYFTPKEVVSSKTEPTNQGG